MTKYDELIKYSNPARVEANALNYFGKRVLIYISNKPEKKYMLKNPDGKWVHFGQMNFEDFTKHSDKQRQRKYLKRAMNIRGNWFQDAYSPNMLAINLLWM